MTIQVSPTSPTPTLSKTAQQRQDYLNRLLQLAQAKSTELNWLQEIRNQAVAILQEQTLPSTRDEEWRFTDLSPLLQVNLSVAQPTGKVDIDPFGLPEATTSRLVFVDGAYAPELSVTDSLPSSLVVTSLVNLSEDYHQKVSQYLAKQPGAEEVFTALNTAGMTDAAVIWVPKNLVVDIPLHLLFISTGGVTPVLSHPRCLVVAEHNSTLTLVEDYVTTGDGSYFTNPVTELWLAENAQVSHIRLQRDSQAAFHIGKTSITQARSSRYTIHELNFGAALSRHNLEVHQTGEDTETHLHGLVMIGGEQLSDTHSAIALSQPYGRSSQLHKCIIGDRAHAVFNGKVVVPQVAQQTDAGQLNRNLLLSPKARVDTKPQLEIVADNVKCTHGATIGQLEADELFYLQSRGINADQARRLLIYAFAYEIIDQVPLPSVQQILSKMVNELT
jgi:Fe-S cluster assembly protein SufD